MTNHLPRLIVASNNKNKLKEFDAILGQLYEIVSMRDAGIDADIEENGTTFEENALIKANYVMNATGCAAIADDSGLEVDALGGAPGVMTARYAGPECDPNRNMDKLLAALEGQPVRTARFRTVIAFIDADGSETVFEGVCEGTIATERHGEEGFGYDPIFQPMDFGGRTFAQMTMGEKNEISHRGKAVRALAKFLNEKR